MSGEMTRPTPPLPHAEPVGILVKTHSGEKHVGGVRWDEEVIAQHDLLRGTREKITEPKTPFNRETVDGVDEESDYVVDPEELASRLQQLQQDTELLQQQQEQQQQQQQQQQQDFKEKRRQHYNEFQQMKLLMQSIEDEDDE